MGEFVEEERVEVGDISHWVKSYSEIIRVNSGVFHSTVTIANNTAVCTSKELNQRMINIPDNMQINLT